MIVHKVAERGAEPLGEFLGSAGDEIAKEVRFESQPETLDGIEVRAVAG